MYYFIENMKPILSNLKLNVLTYLRYEESTKSVGYGLKKKTEMKNES